MHWYVELERLNFMNVLFQAVNISLELFVLFYLDHLLHLQFKPHTIDIYHSI